MKTATSNVVLGAIVLGLFAIAATEFGDSALEVLPVCVSYTAVAILAALALSDYRSSSKGYTAR
jgi:hypothetical protein